MGRWIDVETALPELLDHVLLLTDKGVIEGYRTINGWDFITLNCHGCGCCGGEGDVVTHWMFLPEKP